MKSGHLRRFCASSGLIHGWRADGSSPFQMPGPIRPAGAQLLQMGAQVEQQVTALFLTAASVACATLRDQLRQLAIDALVEASSCLPRVAAIIVAALGQTGTLHGTRNGAVTYGTA